MNNNTDLDTQAALIYQRKVHMDKLWNTYTMDLIQTITASERRYHHQIIPYQQNRLVVKLFGKINIEIVREECFGPIQIAYRVYPQDFASAAVPPSSIDRHGMLDGTTPVGDRQQVFAHYLTKLRLIYDRIIEVSFADEQP